MRVVIATYDPPHGDGLYKIIEDQDQHPSVGDKVVLSSGAHKVVEITWMYSLETPNITVLVEPWRVE